LKTAINTVGVDKLVFKTPRPRGFLVDILDKGDVPDVLIKL
jgi:hypothetical protein